MTLNNHHARMLRENKNVILKMLLIVPSVFAGFMLSGFILIESLPHTNIDSMLIVINIIPSTIISLMVLVYLSRDWKFDQ